MSEHQELLNVLLDADEAHKAEGAMWPELATAILAAGYRKPRQVTTVEELDALPYETVIRTIDGNIWESLVGGWFETASRAPRASSDLFLPATVLHEGSND